MTREEMIEELDILKKSINETVGNRLPGEFTYIANVRSSSAAFVIQSAIDMISKEIRPKGKWVFRRNEKGDYESICTNCMQDSGILDPYNFCPNCGAEMKGIIDDLATGK